MPDSLSRGAHAASLPTSGVFRGVLISVAASVLFALLSALSTLLVGLDAQRMFAFRLLGTVPVVTGFLVWAGHASRVREHVFRVFRSPLLTCAALGCSVMLGVQMWIFLYGPATGDALGVAQGYFLLPLVMVLVGRCVYRERLSAFRVAATVSALFGVLHGVFTGGGVSWLTWVIAFGYPVYFVVRRAARFDALGELWLELVALVPVAVLILWFTRGDVGAAGVDHYWLLVVLLGVLSAAALCCYMVASQPLPFGLFGLLGYLEPALLLLVAVLLGAHIRGAQWFTHGPIWLALLLLGVEGVLQLVGDSSRRR